MLIATLKSEKIPFHVMSNGVSVTLGQVSHFDFDKDLTSPTNKAHVQGLAAAIKRSKLGGAISIVGHTDTHGDSLYNVELSKRRAQTISSLVNCQGLTNKIHTDWKGETQPLVISPSIEGQSANRRVEITITASVTKAMMDQNPRSIPSPSAGNPSIEVADSTIFGRHGVSLFIPWVDSPMNINTSKVLTGDRSVVSMYDYLKESASSMRKDIKRWKQTTPVEHFDGSKKETVEIYSLIQRRLLQADHEGK